MLVLCNEGNRQLEIDLEEGIISCLEPTEFKYWGDFPVGLPIQLLNLEAWNLLEGSELEI